MAMRIRIRPANAAPYTTWNAHGHEAVTAVFALDARGLVACHTSELTVPALAADRAVILDPPTRGAQTGQMLPTSAPHRSRWSSPRMRQ